MWGGAITLFIVAWISYMICEYYATQHSSPNDKLLSIILMRCSVLSLMFAGLIAGLAING